MRKTLGFLILALLILLCVILFAPLTVGFLVEKNYPKLLSQIKSPYVHMQLVSYHRGWFTSKAEVKVQFRNPAQTNAPASAFMVTETVHHGPWILRRHTEGLMLTFAQALVVAHSSNPSVQGWVSSLLEFNQSAYFQFHFPHLQINYPHSVIALNGFIGYIAYTDHGKQLTVQLHVDHAKIRQYYLQTHQKNNYSDLIIENYQTSNHYHNNSGLWFGESRFKIDSLTLQEHNKMLLHLDGIHGESSNDQFNQDTNLALYFTINHITLPAEKVGPLTLELAITGLNSQALNALLQKLTMDVHATTQQKIQALFALLQQGAQLQLTQLTIDTQSGRLRLTGKLSMPKIGQINDLPQVIDQLKAEVNLTIPHDMLLRQLITYYEHFEKQSKNTAKISAQRALAHWLTYKIFVSDGDNIVVKLNFHQGKLTINGIMPSLEKLTVPKSTTSPSH